MNNVLAIVRRAAGSLIFRAVVTAALLAVVLSQLDWKQIGERVSNGNPLYGLLAVLCVVGAMVIGAVRWDSLLKIAKVPLPTNELTRIYLISAFANAFLPTSVGGDVVRSLMVSRRRSILVRTSTTVIIERLVALVALIGLAWVGVVLAPESIESGSLGALAIFTAGMVAGVVVVAVRPSLLRRLASALLPDRFGSSLDDAALVAGALRRSPRLIAVISIQSVAFQVLVTMQLLFLARMIGVDLAFGLAAVALALVTLATLVPISIGGFGVREGSYVLILAGGGVSHSDAVLISLLSVVALFLATLPGAFALIRDGFREAHQVGEA